MNAYAAVADFAERAKRSGLNVVISDTSAEVILGQAQGFNVAIQAEDPKGVVVSGGAWHDHFDDVDEALDCCTFLLSDSCRLRTVYRGSSVESATVQSFEDGDWLDASTVGQLLVPFWRKRRVEFRQNKAINAQGE